MNEEQPNLNHEIPKDNHESGVEDLETRSTHETVAEPAEKSLDIDKVRDDSLEHAKAAHETKIELEQVDDHAPATANPNAIGAELRNSARYRILKNVREHLSPPAKMLSKVVHQPVVDTLSEVGGNTVARPSGVLGGGICALLGSLFFLYLSKHVGFHYNYLLFLLFFVGGFVVGLAIEFCVRLAFHFKQR